MKSLLFAACLAPLAGLADPFPTPFDSEAPATSPMSPSEVVRSMGLPTGFKASVFAAEPDVRQPIAMCFDARGRLWVAECYTYAERQLGYDLRMRDRIVIFEDTKHTGTFDKRTVFWDGAQRLTSIAVGMNGVYALCLPNLVFIPDRNGDDVPDGPPEVLLDGFNFDAAAHTMANGLKWGPDGWLYGRQGILAGNLSRVGPPGAPATERKTIGCGIWRYHPLRHVIEQLTEGTTNPWGMDWNEHGEAFFINTVIGHLWHMIPGAHYRRMFGEDPAPHVYGLIEQHADHVHWDTNELWSDVRQKGVTESSSKAGGGHAHTGLMCYLGENWPEYYRGKLLTINFHGRRLNTERLERDGSGYVGRRGDDLCFVPDPWFRGIEVLQGPDGGVFIADWSDTGECHDHDGVHRNSGRIYKVTFGDPPPPAFGDVAKLGGKELAASLQQPNEWLARQAQRVLQARAAAGADVTDAQSAIRPLLAPGNPVPVRLRALWALSVSGGLADGDLRPLLRDQDEHMRTWAVRLLADEFFPPELTNPPAGPDRSAVLRDFVELGSKDPSALVRLALASFLQRLPVDGAFSRVPLAARLAAHAEDSGDHNLPLMIWYGMAPLPQDGLLEAVNAAKIPLLRRYSARRLAEDWKTTPAGLEALLQATDDREAADDVLEGLAEGFSGVRKIAPPAAWADFHDRFGHEQKLASRLRDLSALFGDGRALDEVRATALDESLSVATRRAALQLLIESRAPELRQICEKLIGVHDLASTACNGLALFDDPAIAHLLVEKYAGFYGSEKPPAIAALVSRPAYATILLEAVSAKRIPTRDVTPFQARQILGFGDPELSRKLTEVWGDIRITSADKAKRIADWKQRLTPEALAQADKSKGRAVFSQTCAVCHKLYGEGASIGPDLTGAGRASLDYLLENIGDPSAVVPAEYRLTILNMKDGRIIAGIVAAKTAQSLTLQTMTERTVLDRSEIKEITESPQSLMPDGLLEALSPTQVRDLIAYLMDSVQAPLPPGS